MKTSLFDFTLPESCIATHPADPRDSARMLVVDGALHDKSVRDLTDYLRPGDVMVFNDTRVIPARLYGKRGEAKIEVLLHKKLPAQVSSEGESVDERALSSAPCEGQQARSGGITKWQCFAKPAKKLHIGDRVTFADDFEAEVADKHDDGQVVLAFVSDCFSEKLQRHGHMPLPPYIDRAEDEHDKSRYQTVYAQHDGSVAAPTAGLHFTPELLAAIDIMGVSRVHVTLHVGGGTFLPVKAQDTSEHVMHSEWAEVTKEAAYHINSAKKKGGRIIAVGTTSLRTLESAADEAGKLRAYSQETDIFITPGYQFKAVDVLLTNFHLPKSTLFMLVSAFCGLEKMQQAYAHAIAQNYRFYSYGDACLLSRA